MPNYGHLSLSCAKIERPSPLRKPSCKVRLFAPNRSRKYRQKVTITTLFQTAFHRIFQLLPQTPQRSFQGVAAGTHSAFGEGSHTAAYTPKQGAFRMGVVSLLSERSARSPTSPGRVSERQTLPLWGLGQGYSQRTQKAFGTAMRLCVSLFRGIAAPLGCVICLQLGDVAVFSLCAQYFLNVRGGGGITTLGAFRTFTNIPGPGIRKVYFAAFGPWPRVLPKNAESLRSIDALMRVAVPRRRGPAGLRYSVCNLVMLLFFHSVRSTF